MKFRIVSIFLVLLFGAALRSALAIGGVDTPPPPSGPHEVTFSQPKETKLENGLRVIVIERPSLPLLGAELVVRNGAEVDPDQLAGVATMTGSLLTRGTETMSAPEIASAMESLGGSIDSGAHWDSSHVTMIVMSDKAEAAFRIMADVVMHPTFKQDEIDRFKNQTLDGLRVALRQPGSLGQFVTIRAIFGTSEYGHAPGGTMESTQAIQRDDIVKLYQAYYRPENAALVLSGNITLEQGRKYAEQFFGGWKTTGQPAAEPASHDQKTQLPPTNIVVDMPDAGQAMVIVARPAIKRSSPDYYAGLVANAALGNGFISRLNREIRIKRGLSYGARSALDARRAVGPFMAWAQTKNASAAEVAGLILSELKRLKTEPVEGEELASRQAVLTGGFARTLETNNGYVNRVASLITQDLPLSTLNSYISSVNAVTAKDVSAFAEKYLETQPSLVVVGKAPEFLEGLKKNFQDIRVIPLPELDLNRPELVKKKE